MNMSSSSNTQMDLMWVAMGVMLVMECFMFYIHATMHKRVSRLEDELADLRREKKQS